MITTIHGYIAAAKYFGMKEGDYRDWVIGIQRYLFEESGKDTSMYFSWVNQILLL